MSRKLALLTLAAGILLLALPAAALAASSHPIGSLLGLAPLGPLGPLAGALGGVFKGIGHAVMGAFTWTIELASKFILTTIGALVKMLIPHSWAHKGLQIMQWIVAVPDYAARVTSPGGGHQYGFAGINALRDLFMWLGIAVAPLTLVYATSRAMLGEAEPVGIPLLRMLAVAVLIVSYPYWWTQAAALADQVTNAILSVPAVTSGLYKLMTYAVTGVVLGGWQLIDLGLMATIGLLLIGLIFLKVALILLGALLYATGPLMIGLVPTQAGGALARAWVSAVAMLFGLGVAWATLFAVGALLISDAGTAGPLIAGNSTIGGLLGGLLLVIAGGVSLWLCLKAAREAAGLLRLQLAGLLTLSRRAQSSSSSSTSTATRPATTGGSLREYGSRLARSASAAGGQLAVASAGGAALVGAGRTAGQLGRRGILGSAAAGVRAGGARALPGTEALLGRSRAGAVAVRMARAGTASWTASHPQAAAESAGQPTPQTHTLPDRAGRPAHPPIPGRQPARPERPGAGGEPRPGERRPRSATPAAGDPAGAAAAGAAAASSRPRPPASPPGRPTGSQARPQGPPSRAGSPARSPAPAPASPSRRQSPSSRPAGKPAEDAGKPPARKAAKPKAAPALRPGRKPRSPK